MRVKAAVRSDIGRMRQRNEDAYLVKDGLFVVADGMGGHRGGDVASTLAVESIESGASAKVTLDELVEEIQKANRALLERGETDRELRGMGTTITAVIAEDAKAHVAHVGDSRAYLLRGGTLQQLTEDHTLVQRLVREGRLTEDEAAHHPQRSVLTRALGVDEEILVDQLSLDVKAGDRVLLCSDGLSSIVDRDRIQEILQRERDLQAACDKLIDAANRAGGDDNITVIVLDFEEGDDSPSTARAEATSRGDGSDTASANSGSPAATATASLPEEGQAATRAVPTVREAETARRAGRPRIRWGRVAVWVAAAVVVVAAALIGMRAYIGHQWYVGDSNGRVAIYNGIPTTILGIDLSHVKEVTTLDARRAERLQPWSDLRDGITASSLEDARTIVEQIRRDLQPGGAG